MNTFPTPDFLREGSLCDHMILIGFPFTTSKFMVSRALSAGGGNGRQGKGVTEVNIRGDEGAW